jgi:hypothetical protein
MAWRPDPACYKTVQLRKVAFWYGFSPVEEAFNTCHLIGQSFKVVSIKRVKYTLLTETYIAHTVTGWYNSTLLIFSILEEVWHEMYIT